MIVPHAALFHNPFKVLVAELISFAVVDASLMTIVRQTEILLGDIYPQELDRAFWRITGADYPLIERFD